MGWAHGRAAAHLLIDELAARGREACVVIPSLVGLSGYHDLLHEATGERPVTLVGWSLGGMAACEFAAHAPELVRQLVLVGTGARFVADESCPEGVPRAEFAAFRRGFARDRFATLNDFFRRVVADVETADELVGERLAEAAEFSGEALGDGLRYLERTDLVQTADAICAPTVILHGEGDPILPCAAGQRLAQLINGAEFIAVPEGGHDLFTTHPRLIADAIL